jgi:hypothetical protein
MLTDKWLSAPWNSQQRSGNGRCRHAIAQVGPLHAEVRLGLGAMLPRVDEDWVEYFLVQAFADTRDQE